MQAFSSNNITETRFIRTKLRIIVRMITVTALILGATGCKMFEKVSDEVPACIVSKGNAPEKNPHCITDADPDTSSSSPIPSPTIAPVTVPSPSPSPLPPPSPALSTSDFAYVTNYTSNSVSVYLIDPVTGGLSLVENMPTGRAPVGVAAHPSNNFLFVSNTADDTIWTYRIALGTGELTKVSSAPTGRYPRGVAVHAGGGFLSVANEGSTPTIGNGVATFQINQSTGALTLIDTKIPDADPWHVALNALGTFAYVVNNVGNTISSYSVSANGHLASTGTVSTGSDPVSVVVHPSGKFVFGVNHAATGISSISVHQVNAGSGTLSPATRFPIARHPWGMAVSPDGKFGFITSTSDSSPEGCLTSVTINQTTGEFTQIDRVISGTSYGRYPIVDPSGRFVYVPHYGSWSISAYSFDSVTGLLHKIGDFATLGGPTTIAVVRVTN